MGQTKGKQKTPPGSAASSRSSSSHGSGGGGGKGGRGYSQFNSLDLTGLSTSSKEMAAGMQRMGTAAENASQTIGLAFGDAVKAYVDIQNKPSILDRAISAATDFAEKNPDVVEKAASMIFGRLSKLFE